MVKGLDFVLFASAGGAGLGPTVQESDGPPGGVPSPAEEGLPHRAARRQQVHTGGVRAALTDQASARLPF